VKDIQAIRESLSNKEDKWLAQEAATSASIQKFGTLRYVFNAIYCHTLFY
jgi:hypothetical protein